MGKQLGEKSDDTLGPLWPITNFCIHYQGREAAHVPTGCRTGGGRGGGGCQMHPTCETAVGWASAAHGCAREAPPKTMVKHCCVLMYHFVK